MSKIYIGIIFTLLLGLGIVFWQYSSVLKSLGELQQANRQLISHVNSMEQQQQQLTQQLQQASEISSAHHDKTLKIVNAEMTTKEGLFQYKIEQLKKQLGKLQLEKTQLKLGVVSTNMDSKQKEYLNEDKSNKCAESVIPEFYLKQL